jgi:selenium metabolism protein YedF
MKIVDTKGQLCPAPLIAAKRALKEAGMDETILILTDNRTSLNNLVRFLKDNKAAVSITKENEIWSLSVTRKNEGYSSEKKPEEYCSSVRHFEKGDFVIAISSDRMGTGDDELGSILMQNFIKAVKDLDKLPSRILFYNKGVTLATRKSPVIRDLADLDKMGVEIILCATCVNHLGIEDQIGTGTLSNMYTIAEIMVSAGKVIRP